VPDQLEACRAALQHVDVISPNHTELCGFFGTEAHHSDGSVGNNDDISHTHQHIADIKQRGTT